MGDPGWSSTWVLTFSYDETGEQARQIAVCGPQTRISILGTQCLEQTSISKYCFGYVGTLSPCQFGVSLASLGPLEDCLG